MAKPNFGEAQLQFCVTQEYLRWAKSTYGEFYRAYIRTPAEEHVLGWDVAFDFPWLSVPPNDEHYGCNLFIQYKISGRITSHAAGQWQDWRQSYLRFRIPSDGREPGDGDDYSQLHALRDLSNSGSEVYYVTNVVQTFDALFALADKEALLDQTPFLDLRDLADDHEFVTFTETSPHFVLHSEPVYARLVPWKGIARKLTNSRGISLSESNGMVLKVLRHYLAEMPGTDAFLAQYQTLQRSDAPRHIISAVEWLILRRVLWLFLGIHMMWFSCPPDPE